MSLTFTNYVLTTCSFISIISSNVEAKSVALLFILMCEVLLYVSLASSHILFPVIFYIFFCIYILYFNFINLFYYFNNLMLFWLILGQRKTSLFVFLWKRRMSSVAFLATILFLLAYIRPLEIILAKKATELVLLFHKNIIMLVFLWPNMDQKTSKC